jgi:hypothetical protein
LLQPCSVTSRMASSLNSFEYRFRVVISHLSFKDYPLTEVSVEIRPRHLPLYCSQYRASRPYRGGTASC